MQFIDRKLVPPPEALRGDKLFSNGEALWRFLQLDPDRRAQTRVPQSGAPSDRYASMLPALFTLFHGRCAFCESRASRPQIHYFRPVNGVDSDDELVDSHIYYSWLANAWQNIYLTCAECNVHGRNYFPVQGARVPIPSHEKYLQYLKNGTGLWPNWPPEEKALVLDPCKRQNFYTHFSVETGGRLIALSEAGNETIYTFGLNRRKLIKQREICFNQYLEGITHAIKTSSSTGLKELFNFSALEFGGSWYLLLRRLAEKIGTRKGPKPILSPTRISRLFLPLLKESRGLEWFNDAVRESQREEPLPYGEFSEEDIHEAKHARINEVAFENFKSLQKITLAIPPAATDDDGSPMASAVLILGENATGKSSILEGIALALTTEVARKKLSLYWRSYVLNPQFMGGGPGQDSDIAHVSIRSSEQQLLNMTLKKGSYEILSEPGFSVGPVFAYGAFRHYQHKRRRYTVDHPVRNLFDGNLLGNPQTWLLGLEKKTFDIVIRALRDVLAIEGDFDVVERDAEVCYIVTLMAQHVGKPVKIRTPLNIVSSGFRSVLAMVCDIMAGLMNSEYNPNFKALDSATGVVLIDEVEAHLHPRWKMQIMKGLRRALPNMTFIATTHDPLCLRGMSKGEVVVLQKRVNDFSPQDNQLPTTVQMLTDLPDIDTLRVDQLLTADFFQLYSTVEPKINQQMAHVADLLAKAQQGTPLNDVEKQALSAFEADIASAMPVGTSEAHRLVQEAVAKYLQERHRDTPQLRESTRDKIVDILKQVLQ
ncbi:AAA family ATPase [Enterobacter sp. Cy-643]|uniref:AAA family ATPase n=1 Tax=Enterobacter sp. Cy-643 TaxID=2608346 RepID=UPI00142354D0|nr:AAA family ATPase [Enterobacter sp. Cy-643]